MIGGVWSTGDLHLDFQEKKQWNGRQYVFTEEDLSMNKEQLGVRKQIEDHI